MNQLDTYRKSHFVKDISFGLIIANHPTHNLSSDPHVDDSHMEELRMVLALDTGFKTLFENSID